MNAFAKPNLAVDQIPSASAADKDKVLTIDANGVPVWAENQGGGGGGAGGGVLVATDTNGTLDKTWQEIYDATFTIIKMDEDGERSSYPVLAVYEDSGEYGVSAIVGIDRVIGYSSSSASGFPTRGSGGGGEE